MTGKSENQLISELTEHGYVAMRAPASGSRIGHEAGDVWAVKKQEVVGAYGPFTELYIIEEKYSSSSGQKYVYESGDKIDSMIEMAEYVGATPLFAVRWSSRVDGSPGAFHVVRDARKIKRTDGGNINMTPERANEKFVSVSDYFGSGI